MPRPKQPPTKKRATRTARPTLTERLAACYTGAVHDVLRMMGHDNIVLPPAIKAIAPGTKLAGPVWTVAGHIDRTKSRARRRCSAGARCSPRRRPATSSSASRTTTKSR